MQKAYQNFKSLEFSHKFADNIDILDSDRDFFEKISNFLENPEFNNETTEKNKNNEIPVFDNNTSFINQSKEEFNAEYIENPYRKSSKSFYIQQNLNLSFENKYRKSSKLQNSSFCLEQKYTTTKTQFSRSSNEVFLGIARNQAKSKERLEKNKNWFGDLKSQVIFGFGMFFL